MRFRLLSLSLAALILAGCAHEGVIVRKQSRPHPFYESLGVDGMYAFLLRDSSGAVHRQQVREDVFERYAEGDYFNDQKSGPSYDGKSDGKTMVRMSSRSSNNASSLANRSVLSRSRQATVRSSTKRKIQVTLPAATDLTVATTVATKKSVPASSSKAKTVAAHSAKKPLKPAAKTPATLKPSSSAMKPASSSTPVLPSTGAGTMDDPAVVFIPQRVR
jgi:hypothetical protein